MQFKKLIWRRSILLPFKHNRACKLLPKESMAVTSEQPDPQPLCSDLFWAPEWINLPSITKNFICKPGLRSSSGCLRDFSAELCWLSCLISGLELPACSSRGLWSSPVLCSSPGGLQLSPNTVKWFLNTWLSTCSVTVSMAAVPGFCSEWY